VIDLRTPAAFTDNMGLLAITIATCRAFLGGQVLALASVNSRTIISRHIVDRLLQGAPQATTKAGATEFRV
jgi:hypothetical protein